MPVILSYLLPLSIWTESYKTIKIVVFIKKNSIKHFYPRTRLSENSLIWLNSIGAISPSICLCCPYRKSLLLLCVNLRHLLPLEAESHIHMLFIYFIRKSFISCLYPAVSIFLFISKNMFLFSCNPPWPRLRQTRLDRQRPTICNRFVFFPNSIASNVFRIIFVTILRKWRIIFIVTTHF